MEGEEARENTKSTLQLGQSGTRRTPATFMSALLVEGRLTGTLVRPSDIYEGRHFHCRRPSTKQGASLCRALFGKQTAKVPLTFIAESGISWMKGSLPQRLSLQNNYKCNDAKTDISLK